MFRKLTALILVFGFLFGYQMIQNNLISSVVPPTKILDTEETELSTDRFGQAIQKTKRISYNKKQEEKEEAVV